MTTLNLTAEGLAEAMENFRAGVVRTHTMRVTIASAAIAYHIAAGHQGTWLALPEVLRCPDGGCMEFSQVVLDADE